MSDSNEIRSTKDYRIFQRHSSENRPVDIKKHKKLVNSMRQYGFLECFPVVVHKDKAGKLIVKDGQHRLAIAEMLGIPVAYVEESTDFDVAVVNSTSKAWMLRDYAQKHWANGLMDYSEGLAFADNYGLPVGTAFALLSGTTSFGNIQDAFVSGEWKVKDRQFADDVASIYAPLVKLSKKVRNARFVEACMAVCRVPGFSVERMVQNSARFRDKLVAYSTRDAYLEMMEDIYNRGRKELLGLKAAAIMEMRKRSPIKKKVEEKSTANSDS